MAELRMRVWLALAGVAALIAAGYPSPAFGPPVDVPRAAGPTGAVPAVEPRPQPPRGAGTVNVNVNVNAGAGVDVDIDIDIDIGPIVAGLRGAPGAVAAIVFDRAAGRILLAEQPDRRFQSASLVKLLIVLDMLAAGPIDEPTAGRLRSMLAASDDAVASDLWVAGGRGAIVRRMASALQLSAVPPPSERVWGHTGISAGDVLAVYRHILDRLGPAERELILSALRAAPRIAADGYDQYFGLPDGLPGLPRAVKQGWSSGQGVVAVHSTGVLGAGDRFVVVLMTEHPAWVGWHTAMRLATATAGLLAPLLASPPDRRPPAGPAAAPLDPRCDRTGMG